MKIHFQSLERYQKQGSEADDIVTLTRSSLRKEEKNLLFVEGVVRDAEAFALLRAGATCVLFWEDAARSLLFQGALAAEPPKAAAGEFVALALQGRAEGAAAEGVAAEEGRAVAAAAEKEAPPLDLTAFIFEGSVKIHDAFAPCHIPVTLQAEWIQRNDGVFDIGPTVAAPFPHGVVSSLNEDFGHKADQIQKSGYTVLEATFRPLVSPQNEALHKTAPIHVGQGKTAETLTLLRHTFHVSWKIAWDYEQKRVESVRFVLPLCPFGVPSPQHDRLWKVQNVEHIEGFQPERPSLLGDVGEMAEVEELEPLGAAAASDPGLWAAILQKALPELKVELFQQFQTKAQVTVLFETGAGLAPGQAITWTQGATTFCGVIAAIECVADGLKREAYLDIKVTPPWLERWFQTPHRVTHFHATEPLQGLTARTLTEANGVVQVEVENDAASQLKAIQKQTFASAKELKHWIRANPTRLRVFLRSLKTERSLHHALEAAVGT
ncbi:hypothetical protein AGMMS49949_06080 [Alphaproteobacteria bacterium]|nr:hypothetical protein AGMMS49949_06080 [Alphaproteobacteria bacterium]GHS98000.1 hypothetical protein AGMMS50296_5410 [Alphaproteobacteria bacterium]